MPLSDVALPPLLVAPARLGERPGAGRRVVAAVSLLWTSALAGALIGDVDAAAPPAVRLIVDAPLPAAPELACYKVETATATYFLEKSGCGLAALIDREGNDWIGFRPQPGSRGDGEFRGFPNAVHSQPGGYFHPRNQGTGPSTPRVEHSGPERVTISGVSGDSQWGCRYDFFPTHCTFTMTKLPAAGRYWVLYEGTPGGRLDDTDWWMTSGTRGRKPIAENHEGDIPAPEWIVFGDAGLKRVLFLLHHEDDGHPDRYYPMRREMTVFGFGRHRGEKFIDSVPQRFSIGLLETTDPAAIGVALGKISDAP